MKSFFFKAYLANIFFKKVLYYNFISLNIPEATCAHCAAYAHTHAYTYTHIHTPAHTHTPGLFKNTWFYFLANFNFEKILNLKSSKLCSWYIQDLLRYGLKQNESIWKLLHQIFFYALMKFKIMNISWNKSNLLIINRQLYCPVMELGLEDSFIYCENFMIKLKELQFYTVFLIISV